MDKPELTNLQRSQIDEMVSMAGELLFEAGSGNRWTRNVLKELAHCLGRLYGETIRTCRGYDGLKDEVQTTFMCGMAISPNFGREEEVKVRNYLDIGDDYMKAYEALEREKTANPKRAVHPSAAKAYGYLLDYRDAGGESHHREDGFSIDFNVALGLVLPFVEPDLVRFHKRYKVGPGGEVLEREEVLRDPGAEAREEKTPGQLLYEKQVEECGEDCPPWKLLDCVTMENLERDARLTAAKSPGQLLYEKGCGPTARPWDRLPLSCRIAHENKAKANAAMNKILDAPVGTPLPPDSPFATIDWQKDDEAQAKAAKPCFKCQGSGNMGFTTYVACDAC